MILSWFIMDHRAWKVKIFGLGVRVFLIVKVRYITFTL